MKILDCTLRDGGYYNNWDFDKSIIDTYIDATNQLPVDYIEVGYRNKPSQNYLGKYAYCPLFELADIRAKSTKKIAIMLNEKDVQPEDLPALLDPVTSMVDMVRIAVDPQNIDRAALLAEAVKMRGYEVAFNVMYMSKWKMYDNFFTKLKQLNNYVDLFCMVDSYGSVTPADIKELFREVKKVISCFIGFHGHNNIELALINALTAIDEGVDFIDSTITGMGRGAGNLKTELLLTYLNKSQDLAVNFNILGDVVSSFSDLYQKYQWGTNLPYMLSGANSLPQKDVMDWVSNRKYSFNSIVRALDNKKMAVSDNAKYPLLSNHKKYDYVIIIGGGSSVISHIEAIREFVGLHTSVALVHATARNAGYFTNLNCDQYYCLIGSEGKRFVQNVGAKNPKAICVLAPFPRVMGTDVPPLVEEQTFELDKIDFTEKYMDSCTAIALQLSFHLCTDCVYISGYDGYPDGIVSEKERSLSQENISLFSDFVKNKGTFLFSLTPTLYEELPVQSIYQFV